MTNISHWLGYEASSYHPDDYKTSPDETILDPCIERSGDRSFR